MRKVFYLGLLVCFMFGSALLFRNARDAYFVSDDWHWLSAARSRSTVFPDLSANYAGERAGGSYNPVSSLWINSFYNQYGLNPAPYHLGSALLHGLVSWLVAVFAALLFKLFRRDAGLAIPFLSGVIFFLWPTHVEAINWIASVPHILAALFYLLSLNAYMLWHVKKRRVWLAVSVVCAGLSFLSKEVAVSLPFVIFALELLYRRLTGGRIALKHFFPAGVMFAAGAAFLYARFLATGIIFGSYADTTIVLRSKTWIHTFLTFVVEMGTMGQLRISWSQFYFDNALFGMAIVIASLAVLLFAARKHRTLQTPAVLFFISTLPYLPLGFNRLSSEGERYTYLPSIFALVFAVVLVMEARRRYLKIAFFVLLILASTLFTLKKNILWATAGDVSRSIITQFDMHRDPLVTRYLFVLLPDTLQGVHVFRNNIREAIELTYPDFDRDVRLVPVYLQLDRKNYASQVVSWRSDERGLFAEGESGSPIITGIDRRETDLLTYELWNYDYDTFSSDTVRLIFSEELITSVIQGETMFLSWHRGLLRQVQYKP